MTKIMRVGSVALVLTAAVLWGGPAHAEDTLDVEKMLNRAGVRLVVVEFYATWCKPCMEAIPRWKALHDKYRDQGLRLIVVNTQDPNGVCGTPGWTPDEMVCDIDGYVAGNLGVGDLPSAFLWSWQGNLLIQKGHVEEVEDAIERYFNTNPRIVVETTGLKGKRSRKLRELIRNKFSDRGKFQVVGTKEEQAIAARVRKEAFKGNYNRAGRCKLGQEVSANSIVRVSRGSGRLNLQLFSAESSCLLQSASVPYSKKNSTRSAAEVVDKLLSQVQRKKLQMPGGEVATRVSKGSASIELYKQKIDDGSNIKNMAADETGFISVRSSPDGATIKINGKVVGNAPYQDEWPVGRYVIIAEHPRHHPTRKEVKLTGETAAVTLTLTPAYGSILMESIPPGATLYLNDERVGVTPITLKEKLSGMYRYRLEKELYLPKKGKLRVRDGEETKEKVVLSEMGSIHVETTPPGATFYLDDQRVGETPLTLKGKRAGAYNYRIEKKLYLSLKGKLLVKNGGQTHEEITLTYNAGTLEVTSYPAGADITLNGEATGKTTPYTFKTLQAGVHWVELTQLGYGKVTNKAVVKRSKVTPFNKTLPPLLGRLVVTAETMDGTPCAGDVFIDEVLSGETPLKKDVLALPHTVRVECAQGSFRTTVEVEHRKRFRVRAQVVAGRSGRLVVAAEDRSGKVIVPRISIDGRAISATGEFPLKIGKHELGIERSGMQPITTRVLIEEDSLLKVNAVLAKQDLATASKKRRFYAGTGAFGLIGAGIALAVFAPDLDEIKTGKSYQAYLTSGNSGEALKRYGEFESEVAKNDLRRSVGFGTLILGLASSAWWGWETLREVSSSWTLSAGPVYGAAGVSEIGVMAGIKGEFDGFGGQD